MSTPRPEDGYTISELLVVMALLGAMMAIAVTGYSAWSKASGQRGAAEELQSVLSQVHQRAVTEGTAMCVSFDVAGNRFSVFRGRCGDTTKELVQGPVALRDGVRLSAPAFAWDTDGDGTGETFTAVAFYARGDAWPGTVELRRDGSNTSYTLTVEGLTGRVSVD